MRRYIIEGSGGIDALRLQDVPDLGAPGPGEVVVRMRAASLNYRDLLISKGLYPLAVKVDPIPVSDGAGEVIMIGEGVTGLAAGSRVMSCFFPDWAGGGIEAERIGASLGGSVDGVLAEQVLLPAGAVIPFPAHLSFAEAATLPCAALTAWNALVEVGGIRAGDVVLVQGTGGVSSFALQFSKLFGAVVIQTSSSDEKLAAAKARGADHLINYMTTPDWDAEARRITGGRGVDIVVEIGGAGTLDRSLRAVRLGGTVVTIGLVTGLGTIDAIAVLAGVARLNGVIVGSRDMAVSMNRAITAGGLRPLIDRTFAFEAAPDAYRYLESGAGSGKIVVTI